MDKKDIFSLKLLATILFVLYLMSLLWISMMFLYGLLYYPINDTFLEKIIPFPLWVTIWTLLGYYLIFFKLNSISFKGLFLQNALILIFSIPFYSTLLSLIHLGFDDDIHKSIPVTIIYLLYIGTTLVNDFLKLRH